jgi:hypothetical protein
MLYKWMNMDTLIVSYVGYVYLSIAMYINWFPLIQIVNKEIY